MTQKEKQLLLKDLCGRLPYGVKVDHFGVIRELLGVIPSSFPEEIVMVGYDSNDYEDSIIEDIKPYLRPMSSMTEKEREEYRTECKKALLMRYRVNNHYPVLDWLNKKMLDYRGLIPMGLALEAPEEMYKTE